MLSTAPILLPQTIVDEAKEYLRIAGSEEDVLVARLMQSAIELCEQFTGQMILARDCSEVLATNASWVRLAATPVRSVAGVEGLSVTGPAIALSAQDYAIDIDANGDGWVRVVQAGGARRVRVSFEAGMAADWAEAPEAIRQGVVRLMAHLYTSRDAPLDAGPPAAVTALWRPWRRMRLG